MIRDFLYVIAMDRHGALLCHHGDDEGERSLMIGGHIALGVNVEITEDLIMEFAREQQKRLGDRAQPPERIGDFEHEGVNYYLVFIQVDCDMWDRFTHRWFVESELDFQSELSAIAWEMVRDRPFTPRSHPALVDQAKQAPNDARRMGQFRALWDRLFPYANAHSADGVVIVVRDKVAILVDGAGNELGSPRPVNIDTLCPELQAPTEQQADAELIQ